MHNITNGTNEVFFDAMKALLELIDSVTSVFSQKKKEVRNIFEEQNDVKVTEDRLENLRQRIPSRCNACIGEMLKFLSHVEPIEKIFVDFDVNNTTVLLVDAHENNTAIETVAKLRKIRRTASLLKAYQR